MIYMDNAATSFPKPEGVSRAVLAALAAPASPGRSGHAASIEASRIAHRARKAVSELFGLKDNSRLVFTPNVTWALNAAICGLCLKPGDHVISSALEHNSTARPLERLRAERGVVWETAPAVGPAEAPQAFKKLLRPETRLVVLNHASNVSGALAPAREIKRAIGGVPLLLDTAQTAGALPMGDCGDWVDLLAFTGHKGLMGPTGTGGLWVAPSITLRSLAVGGTGSRSESLAHPDFLPDALEAGTGNTHGLAGLAAGVEWVLGETPSAIRKKELALTGAFIEAISPIKGLRLQGPPLGDEGRVATVSLNLDGWSSSDLAAALEKEGGVLTRSGLHCAPLAHQSLGTFPHGSVRFSFGPGNSLGEIEAAAGLLRDLAPRGRG
jgi:cysteine desulfurase family protein